MKRVLNLIHRGADDATLAACRRLCRPGDAIVLRGVAVTAALADGAGPAPEAGLRWYVLAPDLVLHGLAGRRLHGAVVPVDYRGLVALVCEYELCQSW